jgi:hypothetical protein
LPFDHDNVFCGPAKRDGAVAERILARGTFRVFEDLVERTLADVQAREPL